MSSGEEWANDGPRRGCPLSLVLLAAVVAVMLSLAACRPSTVTPPAPATGVQPQPPGTAVVPSAVQVKP